MTAGNNIFMWLLQNGAAAGRFLRLLTLLPALIPLVQVFEKRADLTGPEKKKAVLDTLDLLTDVLQRRGYITAGMNNGLDEIAAEIIDLLVGAFKTAGIFGSTQDPAPVVAAVVVVVNGND